MCTRAQLQQDSKMITERRGTKEGWNTSSSVALSVFHVAAFFHVISPFQVCVVIRYATKPQMIYLEGRKAADLHIGVWQSFFFFFLNAKDDLIFSALTRAVLLILN